MTHTQTRYDDGATNIHTPSMIQLQHHRLHSPLSVEAIHGQIEERLTNNIGLALSPNQKFLFSGTLTQKGFTLAPIQKGRSFPMPRLYGTYHPNEQGTDLVIIGKPGLSSTLEIITWCIAGVGISVYAMSSLGIYAIGLMLFPLLYIGIKFWLLHREIRLGIHILTDLLCRETQPNP